jgi:hypothetical protein
VRGHGKPGLRWRSGRAGGVFKCLRLSHRGPHAAVCASFLECKLDALLPTRRTERTDDDQFVPKPSPEQEMDLGLDKISA